MKHQYSKRTCVVQAIALILFFIFLIAWFSSRAKDTSRVYSVDMIATRGSSILVLRLPQPSEGDPWEEIVVNDKNAQSPRKAYRFPVVATDLQRSDVQLPLPQWQTINNLRERWCESAPSWAIEDDEPVYEVGLRCGNPSGFFPPTKRVSVPLDQLPSELVELIETVPSNTCDDPFCGWRNPYP